MAEPAPLGLLPRVVAAVVALISIGAAVAVVLTARHTTGLEADNRTRAVTANAVPAVAASLRNALTELQARGGAESQLVGADGADGVAAAGVPPEVVVQARDLGRAMLTEAGTMVVAKYDTPAPPKTVSERRAAFAGVYVVPFDVGPTLDRLRPAGGGVALVGPSRVVASVGGAAPEGSSSYAVTLSAALAKGWDVRVWTPGGTTPVTAWLAAALCLLAGALVVRFVLRRAREVEATASELDRLRGQSSVLAGLAGVAQRSLDLADVLPAITTQLSDALGLRGLSLTTPTPRGERAFFRHGESPTPVIGSTLPQSVPSGESVSLLLARAGRTVARLNVLAGRELDAEDLVTLEAAGDILTSALTNAEAFAQQREALQRLRAVDELKTVFLATASHELRTPVGVISGFAELLAKHVEALDHDRVRDYAGRIDTTAQQLASLVENLLDFSRMERGVGGEQEHVVLDLGAVSRRILDQHQDLSTNHQVLLSAAQEVPVRGTEHAVERVLTNLVGNASKYSPAGTTIRVLVRREGDRVALHVDDEGPGVPAADRDRVFSRFYRGSGDAVVGTRGAGLGLAIVHEFAASMGGVASVSEAPTGGARFSVLFPAASDVPSPDLDPDGARDPSSVPLTAAGGTTDVLT